MRFLWMWATWPLRVIVFRTVRNALRKVGLA